MISASSSEIKSTTAPGSSGAIDGSYSSSSKTGIALGWALVFFAGTDTSLPGLAVK